MTMILNEAQLMLKDMAQDFFSAEAGVATLRRLRDTDDAVGYDPAVWRKMADLGFAGILLPEADGGLELGHVEAGIIAEAIGRNLSPGPFLVSAVGAAPALRSVDSPYFRQACAALAKGHLTATIAIDEGNRHEPEKIALRADLHDGGFKLSGAKTFVPHGHVADLLIVAARPSEGSGVFLCAVEKEVAGLSASPLRHIDSGLYSDLSFEDVLVPADHVIASGVQGKMLLDLILDGLRLASAAELVGIAREVLDRTVVYLRERVQFGAPVGSFQALQHRAAHLYAEIEVAGAAVLKAQSLLDEGDSGAGAAISVAKAFSDMAASLAVQEAVQLHGGIGMTDELDIGLFMKRAKLLSQLYGGADFHAGRIASLNGY